MRVYNVGNKQSFEVAVGPDDTVLALNQKIQETLGIPIHYHKLSIGNTRILNMSRQTLMDLGVDDEVKMEVMLHGGCGESCQCCGLGESCFCTVL